MITTLFNYNDALNICIKQLKDLTETNKKPIIYDNYNSVNINISNLKLPIWKMTELAIKNTLHYIYNIICHQCYLFTIINEKKTLYKLLPSKLSDTYLTAIKNAKHEVNKNQWINDYQKNYINKLIPNRIMQCIVKTINIEKPLDSNEYLELFETFNIPDGIYILNLTDAVIMHEDNLHPFEFIMNFSNNKKFNKESEYLPILSLSLRKKCIDIPIPNYDDIEYVYDKQQIKKNMHDKFITSWDKKTINKAVFRGSPTGCGYTNKTNMRLKIYELSLLDEYKDRLDIGITGNKGSINTQSVRLDPIYGLGMLNTDIKPGNRLDMVEQSHYKYIIHIDGNVNAYRLLYTMTTGSLILRVDSDYKSWAEDYLIRDIHYKSIKSDLSDLKEILDWCDENQEICKKIANNAMKLTNILLTKNFMKYYFEKLFWNFEINNTEKIITFKTYFEYKKNRIKIQPLLIDYKKANEPESCKVAIILPHRDRIDHLKKFIRHFNKFKLKHQLDIYVINQHNHLKFNRGLLLNIGYYIASHHKYDRYIFHDVDSYPDDHMFELYFKDLDKIIHFDSKNEKYHYEGFFGGVEGFNSSMFEKVNGFPNNFFGWGGEDDALYNRLIANNLIFYQPSFGKYTYEQHVQSTDLNSEKSNLILEDLNHWKKNGIQQIENLNILASELSMDDFIDTYNEKKLIQQHPLNYIVKQFKVKKNNPNYFAFHIDFYINSENNIITINKYDCDISKIKSHPIYKGIHHKNLMCNYQRIIRNFKNYILNEPNIDYTYIWDYITSLMTTTLDNKFNLIIMDMPNNDGSQYIDLICPPNKYTDDDKYYAILLRRGNIYNPIIAIKKYMSSDNLPKDNFFYFFNKNDSSINYNLYQFLNLVPSIFNKCSSEHKNPLYTNNIDIITLFNILTTINQYKIKEFIFNHYFDIIGFKITYKDKQFPIYGIPINYFRFKILYKIEIKSATYNVDYLPYHTIKSFLEDLYDDSKQEIPCKPLKKVSDENNQITGILTICNTFIPVIPDIIIDDELPIHRDINPFILDNDLLNHTEINEDHEQYTRSIELETKMYNLFRLFIKNHLTNSIQERQELLHIYNSDHPNKLEKIYNFLIKEYKDKIIFKEINNLNDIQILNKCIYECMTTKCKKRLCDLIIPFYNLVSGVKNDTIYFSRLADEILRYRLIHNFILKNNSYLPFYDTKYKINKDEILITKNLLDQYFDNLEPLKPFENTTYHNINENLQTIYKNIDLNEFITNKDCFYIKKIIDTRKLLFDYPLIKERIYINSSICTVQMILDIINDFTNQQYDYNYIRQLLLKLYKKYPVDNIRSLLYKEGKLLSSLNYILEDKYYFTPIDIKILADHFKLPIINLSSKEKYIKNINDIVYCITNTDINNNIIPSYSIIMNNETLQLNMSHVNLYSKYEDLNDIILKTKIYQQIK